MAQVTAWVRRIGASSSFWIVPNSAAGTSAANAREKADRAKARRAERSGVIEAPPGSTGVGPAVGALQVAESLELLGGLLIDRTILVAGLRVGLASEAVGLPPARDLALQPLGDLGVQGGDVARLARIGREIEERELVVGAGDPVLLLAGRDVVQDEALV